MPMHFGHSIGQRRFLLEWSGSACFGIVVTLLLVFLHLGTRLDYSVYDSWLSARTLPVSPDIVLVDIDDASLAALGRWPWSRNLHAALLTRLKNDGAAAVVYDVLFTEPSADDTQFAHALAQLPSFLPIQLMPTSAGKNKTQLPVALFARQVVALGHINLEPDSDGVVRSIALQETGDHSLWPQLMVPVAEAIRHGVVVLPGAHGMKHAASPVMAAMPNDARVLIPFSRNTENYQHVSFADVLAGHVPPSVLKNRIVLVGVTASGLYQRFATPLSGAGYIPGVYIHASVLDMLMHGTQIKSASIQWIALASLAPLIIWLAGLFIFTPARILIFMVILDAALFAGSAALLFWEHIWLSPVEAAIALLVVYLVWNWRRLEMTMAYFRDKLRQFVDEPYLLGEVPAMHHKFPTDPLAQQMALMTQAIQRLQDMRRFIWDSLDSVPELVFVSDRNGIVRFINRVAREYSILPTQDINIGLHIQDVLGKLSFVKALIDTNASTEITSAKENWPAPLDPARHEYTTLMTQGIEVRNDASERHYILRYARHDNAQNKTVGWIASLFDISALRHAQRQHDETLQLLSHDMRSPQASILTLIKTEYQRGNIPESMQMTMKYIERYAQRTMLLAEKFVQLARAESKDYEFEPLNFTDLLIDASDEVWPQAQEKHIQIDMPRDSLGGPVNMANAYWIRADRSMMTRALVNILSNAVKYSPSGTRITCSTHILQASHTARAHVACVIRDQGYGMTPEEQAQLFDPFRRFHMDSHPKINGVGLGMTFVKTVVLRHNGEITVASEPGKGTTITISLPMVETLPV